MKCNRCNSEVAEGTNFCPECGSRIEQPQPQKCAKCNTEVEDGVKFCPNCGEPIGHPEQVHEKHLSVIWDGDRNTPIWNNPISLSINNQKCADFSPKETFERIIATVPAVFNMQLEYGKGPFNKTEINLNLDPNQGYVLFFYLNSMGTFGYELQDEQGRLIEEDGNTNMAMVLLFMLIPLIGFIYYFIKKDNQPLSAKAGMFLGFGSIILWIILQLFI